MSRQFIGSVGDGNAIKVYIEPQNGLITVTILDTHSIDLIPNDAAQLDQTLRAALNRLGHYVDDF